MTKYFHNITEAKTYAYDPMHNIDEAKAAGHVIAQADKDKESGMGDFLSSNPEFIRVSAKVYAKFGVKTQSVAKVRKNISVADLANMSADEIQTMLKNIKSADASSLQSASKPQTVKVKKA